MEAWSWPQWMKLSIGRVSWMRWLSRSRRVFAGLSRAGGYGPICRACLLLWSARTAGNWPRMPADTAFATKPQLGRQMLTRAFAAGVPCRWVTGDSVYGVDYALRRCIEKGGRGYVLAVTSRQRLGFKTVADWLEDVPRNGWQRLSAGPALRQVKRSVDQRLPMPAGIAEKHPDLAILDASPTGSSPAAK